MSGSLNSLDNLQVIIVCTVEIVFVSVVVAPVDDATAGVDLDTDVV